MVKKKINKRICVALALICICAMSVPVHAQTVEFNITVSHISRIDPISKRATKADNEQSCYVTVTGGTGTGILRAHSERLNGGVVSMNMNISIRDKGNRKKSPYAARAKAGEHYFLNTHWGSGADKVNLLGRYTP